MSQPPSSGGSGGVTLLWARDSVTRTTTFSTGFSLSLSETVYDADAIVVFYNGQALTYGTDYSYNGGTNSVSILFGNAPTVSNPDYFTVQYPYETP